MARLVALLALCAGLSIGLVAAPPLLADGHASAPSALTVEDGWIRQTPPGRDVAAGYLVLRNGGAADVRLVDARADGADRVEFHTHEHDGGMMRMRRLERVDVVAGETVRFAPGGLHVMLFGVDATRAGAEIAVVLVAEDGAETTLVLPVRRGAPGAGDPS